jgi:hypothetical protein
VPDHGEYQEKPEKTPEENDLERRDGRARVFDAKRHEGKTDRALGHQLNAGEIEFGAFHFFLYNAQRSTRNVKAGAVPLCVARRALR